MGPDAFMPFPRAETKWKQPRLAFELGFMIPFPTIICNILALLATMNLRDSMRSQDNINKVEKIKKDGKEYSLLLMDRVMDVSIRRWDRQMAEKGTEVCGFWWPAMDRGVREARKMFVWNLNNIGSAVLEWVHRFTGRSSEQERTRWSLKQTCQLLVCVLRPLHNFTMVVPATEERCVRALSDCVTTTHSRRVAVVE